MKPIKKYFLTALSLLALAKPIGAMEGGHFGWLHSNECKMLVRLSATLIIANACAAFIDGVAEGLAFARDAEDENIWATIQWLEYDDDTDNPSEANYRFMLRTEKYSGHQLLNVVYSIVNKEEPDSLEDLIKHAPFNPKSTAETTESRERITTFLLALNRKKKAQACYNLPRVVRHQILSYLPEDTLNEKHFQIQMNFGGLATLVETCPYAWFVNLADNLTGKDRIYYINTITPYIVDFRLTKLRELFNREWNDTVGTPQTYALAHNRYELADLLDPEKIDQHRDMLSEHIRHELLRGRTSMSPETLTNRLKRKRQELEVQNDNNQAPANLQTVFKTRYANHNPFATGKRAIKPTIGFAKTAEKNT